MSKPVRNRPVNGRRVARAVGACAWALIELTDDCSIQGRRRRSEIAGAVSRGEILQGVCALAA